MAGGGGVRGRPQSCLTCFRRKKGCDLQRPSCGQCRKACIPCGGYDRTRTRAAGAVAEDDGGISQQQPTSGPVPIAANIAGSQQGSSYPYASIAAGPPRPLARGTTISNAELPLNPQGTGAGLPISPQYSSSEHWPPRGWSHAVSSQTSFAGHMQSSVHPETHHLQYSRPELVTSLPAEYMYMYAPVQAPTPESLPKSLSPDAPPPASDHPSRSLQADYHARSQRLRHSIFLREKVQQREQSIDLSVSAPLSRFSEEGRFISLFWEAYLPNGKPFPQGTFQMPIGASAAAVMDLSPHAGLQRKTLLATALTTVGKQDGADPWLREEGYRIYGEALSDLSKSLKSRRKWDVDLLIATRQFALYEALHGANAPARTTQGKSWLVHSTGDVAVLTSKPPSAYAHGLAHNLFTAGRHNLVLSAMMARKRTFLSDPEWKTAPWSEIEKTARDHLIDVLVDIPSIIEGMDHLIGLEEPRARDSYRKLLRKATQGVTDRLLEWNSKYDTPIVPETVTSELPPTVGAQELADAHVMSLYWATCIRIFNIQRKLLGPGERLEHRLNPDQLCQNIVRAIRLFLHPSIGIFRQHVAPFPLGTAIQHIRAIDRHKMTVERKILFESLASPECRPIRDFIMSIDTKGTTKLGGVRTN